MFCVNCGKTVPSDAQFCINCGSSVPDAARQTAPLTAAAGGSSWSSEPLTTAGGPEYGAVGSTAQPQVGLTPQTTISVNSNLMPLPSGNDPALLDRLPQWNWGAFLLTPLWAAFHRLWLIAVISFFFGGFCWPVVNIVAGLIGNKEAWKARPFSSYEEFQEVQRKWMIGGLIVTVGSIALFFGLFMLIMLAGATSSN